MTYYPIFQDPKIGASREALGPRFGPSGPRGFTGGRVHNRDVALRTSGLFDRHELTPQDCRRHLQEAEFARVIVSIRCLPAAHLVRSALVGETLLIASDEESVVTAAERGDIVTLQIDGLTPDGGTWTVQATGMSWLVSPDDAATYFPDADSLLPYLERGATLLAVPLTLIRGDYMHWNVPRTVK